MMVRRVPDAMRFLVRGSWFSDWNPDGSHLLRSFLGIKDLGF